MSLSKAIFNFFKSKDSFPKEPSDFFSGERTTELIERLNARSPRAIGLSSLDALALKICEISQADYIFIAKISKEGTYRTISICNQTSPIQNSHFDFKINAFLNDKNPDIPVSFDAQVIFSQTNLPKSKANNCIALQITDNDKTPMGIVLGVTKSAKTKTLTNVIKFFSNHLTTEMRHLNSKEKLEKKNKKLLRTEEELKLKNQLLDNLNKNISKAKQVVDESSRLKSAFLANLSHEIRTPMNVIMGFTELLSAANMTPEQRRNYIDIIQQNGTRLLQIMDSLIDISRFQAKNIGKEQQAFSLNQMLQQLYNNFNSEIEASGKPITLTLTLSKNHGEDVIILDKEATYKVLNHLLDNAVKFTASGTIRFGYEIKEKQILFHVEDTGIGIPEGKEKEIFDLFRQGDLRLSRQFGGTGLGLAIAKRYVSAMNGQIWCNNNEDSARGATFKFSLPLLSSHKERNEGLSQKTAGAFTTSSITMISNESLL
ncbi:sensor histidine kinase [Marinilabilia salmonicolor]|uniref:sensor histidine kinase n=1 Tax=Marinilabilia salmonicolor TaxID=989 RepID=UPI00029A8F36|nr:ATP-binding protein [Marinilabilia salmonicolor]